MAAWRPGSRRIAGWLPVYYNLGDEPIGDAVIRASENSEAYTKAFPQGPPWFTFATSYTGGKTDDPHYRLSKALDTYAFRHVDAVTCICEGLRRDIRVKTSSFTRHHVNVSMTKTKTVGNYVNSIMAKLEAVHSGSDEALLLATAGYVCEPSGENTLLVKDGILKTPPSDLHPARHHPGLRHHAATHSPRRHRIGSAPMSASYFGRRRRRLDRRTA